jgi:hypothetical protein
MVQLVYISFWASCGQFIVGKCCIDLNGLHIWLQRHGYTQAWDTHRSHITWPVSSVSEGVLLFRWICVTKLYAVFISLNSDSVVIVLYDMIFGKLKRSSMIDWWFRRNDNVNKVFDLHGIWQYIFHVKSFVHLFWNLFKILNAFITKHHVLPDAPVLYSSHLINRLPRL